MEKLIGVIAENLSNHEMETISANKVVLATGGRSYSVTGSTGDGYELAKKLGHNIIPIKPSLVALESFDKKTCQMCQGLSLRTVAIKLIDNDNKKTIYSDFGEMLFTHFGVSGPIILSASSHLLHYENVEKKLLNKKITLQIDLKPALEQEKLDDRILRDFEDNINKQFKNSLGKLLPQKIIEAVIEISNINPEKKVNEITKEERRNLEKTIKQFSILISVFRDI